MKTPFLATLLLAAGPVLAHPHHDHDTPPGMPPMSSPKAAAPGLRTVNLEMTDGACDPREVRAAAGEALKIVAANKSSRVQDVAVGTADELKGQAEMIRKFPQMQAAKSTRVSVKPGQSAELAWNAAAESVIACGAPGEFDAAKATKVVIAPK